MAVSKTSFSGAMCIHGLFVGNGLFPEKNGNQSKIHKGRLAIRVPDRMKNKGCTAKDVFLTFFLELN